MTNLVYRIKSSPYKMMSNVPPAGHTQTGSSLFWWSWVSCCCCSSSGSAGASVVRTPAAAILAAPAALNAAVAHEHVSTKWKSNEITYVYFVYDFLKIIFLLFI